jgi:hypothetical protein
MSLSIEPVITQSRPRIIRNSLLAHPAIWTHCTCSPRFIIEFQTQNFISNHTKEFKLLVGTVKKTSVSTLKDSIIFCPRPTVDYFWGLPQFNSDAKLINVDTSKNYGRNPAARHLNYLQADELYSNIKQKN